MRGGGGAYRDAVQFSHFCTFGDNLSIVLGASATTSVPEYVSLQNGNVQGNLVIRGGTHDTACALVRWSVDGRTSIRTSGGDDNLSIQLTSFASGLSISMSGGDDSLIIDSVAVSTADFRLGAGDDQAYFGTFYANGSPRIDGGSGFDTFRFGIPNVPGYLVHFEQVI